MLKRDAEIYFNKVDLIETFTIVGGEPFVHPWLGEFIEYVLRNYAQKIKGNWIIIANGTIVLGKKIRSIKKYDGCIEKSDYSSSLLMLKEKLSLLHEKVKEWDIQYSCFTADQRVDFKYGDENIYKTKDKLKNIFKRCNMPCRLFLKERFFTVLTPYCTVCGYKFTVPQ